MNALNAFKVFAAAKELLEASLTIRISYDVEVNTEDKYQFDNGDLRWGLELEDDEFVYSEEASLMQEFDDCEIYLVRSCTGNKFLFVLDKSNKVEV